MLNVIQGEERFELAVSFNFGRTFLLGYSLEKLRETGSSQNFPLYMFNNKIGG